MKKEYIRRRLEKDGHSTTICMSSTIIVKVNGHTRFYNSLNEAYKKIYGKTF